MHAALQRDPRSPRRAPGAGRARPRAVAATQRIAAAATPVSLIGASASWRSCTPRSPTAAAHTVLVLVSGPDGAGKTARLDGSSVSCAPRLAVVRSARRSARAGAFRALDACRQPVDVPDRQARRDVAACCRRSRRVARMFPRCAGSRRSSPGAAGSGPRVPPRWCNAGSPRWSPGGADRARRPMVTGIDDAHGARWRGRGLHAFSAGRPHILLCRHDGRRETARGVLQRSSNGSVICADPPDRLGRRATLASRALCLRSHRCAFRRSR